MVENAKTTGQLPKILAMHHYLLCLCGQILLSCHCATIELECRLDNTVQYECKESEFDFTEISLLSVPSQVTSSSQ